MEFDDRGRVWVAECYTYAKHGYSEQFKDRIIILEDQNQDGVAEKRTVFWEQGNRLTSILPGFGGVFILNNGTLSFLADKNQDDKPDGPPEILLDGFNKNEVGHNIVNGLIWGPDGWIYARHGIQATSRPAKPGTPIYQRQKMNCAIWRFHPISKRFEILTQGTTNPWGLDFNEAGELFFTNNVIGHLWHVIPGASYKRMYGGDNNPHHYELIDQHADHYHWDTGKKWSESRSGEGLNDTLGGGHSHCGGMIYLGDNWPKKYRGKMFLCNTHGRRVNCDSLERSGSGYTIKHQPDFLFANQPWFRGVNLYYGPNGTVYLTDWTDLGECHDHDGVHRTSGRIYRVAYGTPKSLPGNFNLQKYDDEQLVKTLHHPNQWFVRHARRILQERNFEGKLKPTTIPAIRWQINTTQNKVHKLNNLWTLTAIGEEYQFKNLAAEDEAIRAWAIRSAMDRFPFYSEKTKFQKLKFYEPIISFLKENIKTDSSALVRLHVASALQRLPLDGRLELAILLASHPKDANDHNLPLMIWYGVEPAVVKDHKNAIELARSTPILKLTQFISRRIISELESRPKMTEQLLSQLATLKNDPKRATAILQGMADGLRGWRKAKPPANWPQIQTNFSQMKNPVIQNLLQELSVVFGDGRALDSLKKIAQNKEATAIDRANALKVLIQNRDKNLPEILLPLVHSHVSELKILALKGLAEYNHPKTPIQIFRRYSRFDLKEKEAAINTLCSRPAYALILLEKVKQGTVNRSMISAYHVRQMTSLENAKVTKKLKAVWGTIRETAADKKKLIEKYKTELTKAVLAKADLPQGRLLFNKTCASCHKLYGQGGAIGPDLTGSNRDNLDYLLENMIDPSKTVAKQFTMSAIIRKSGRITTGIIRTENKKTITLQTDKEQLIIDKSDILRRADSALSMMPDGVIQKMTSEQIRDLIGYLSAKKQAPLPPKKINE